MLSFALFYSFALVLVGLSGNARLRYGGAALVLFTAALIGYSSWLFFSFALGYVLLTAWLIERPGPAWLDWSRRGLWLIASILLALHAAPGYAGLQLAGDSVLKPGSIAVDLYINHDKVLIAWSLLSALPLFGVSLTRPAGLSARLAAPLVAVAVAGVLALAWALGLIDWRPTLPAWFWVFAFSNLLNTCLAEELLFRGLVQRQMQGYLGPWPALGAASVLFGLAHFAAGWGYILVATLAGLVYGLAYLWSGRLIVATGVHWGLNLAHLVLFTYPMST